MKPNILDTTTFKAYAKEHKLQPFRVKQVYHEIFTNQNITFSDMTTLSKELRDELESNFSIIPLEAENIIEDEDTTKIGFITEDGFTIEAVILYHRSKLDEDGGKMEKWKNGKISQGAEDNFPPPQLAGSIFNRRSLQPSGSISQNKLNRITLCISSQIGCPINCLFCVTGKLGLKRNLSREEIIGQVLYANNYIKNKFGKKDDGTLYGVRNVVFMGMGEPLLNYENMKKSIVLMLAQEVGLSLSRRHITISTAGIIPGIKKLVEDDIPVKLAISLHAPNQQLRDTLMPIAKKYPLDELMKTIDNYVKATDNRIFYEYIMIKNVTDKLELAHELACLLRGRLAHVNLIAYNQNPAIDLQESDTKQMRKF
ncbi:MAG: 23S rRNA (adenine(2503)-C(2))-methyltransferase RlmN, partial [Candidatus Absconditabacterales bacterium]